MNTIVAATRRLTIATGTEGLGEYSSPHGTGEGELLARLRGGDEDAFACLVDRHHAAMIRFARGYVRSPVVAEEAAQDAWLGLLRGLDRFEGRSSLRTWLFRIVANRAISAGRQERQHLPVDDSELEDDGGRFSQDGWGPLPRSTGPTRPSTAWWRPSWWPGCASSWRSCRAAVRAGRGPRRRTRLLHRRRPRPGGRVGRRDHRPPPADRHR